jgi:outer membrane protein OmpA-like peptidoglycan-associated protein
MRLLGIVMVVAVLATCVTGCVTRGTREIPYHRDYSNLVKTPILEAQQAVDKAHRVGAQHYAPFEYFAGAQYLAYARTEKAENDLPAFKDYTNLAKEYAEKAIEKGSGIPDKGPIGMYADKSVCQAEFDRLVARFKELNRCKAILVSPVIYAHVEATLSEAEHELAEPRHWPQAARRMVTIEPDIDTIWSQDVDKDGIVDMKDGDPWAPEDKDGFQDADGIPEPKPYPVLDAVHFKSDCDKLNADAKGYLRGIAHMLVDGYSEATLHLSGHTDTDHTAEYNVDLSKRRISSVQKYLKANRAKVKQVKAVWHGETKPVADNATKDGKAKNRRVELKLDSPDVKSPYCN